MPGISNRNRPTEAYASQTKRAAESALDRKVITSEQFARMTDGTVSKWDIVVADRALQDIEMFRSVASTPDGITAARGLHEALVQQFSEQRPMTRLSEGLKDYFDDAKVFSANVGSAITRWASQ